MNEAEIIQNIKFIFVNWKYIDVISICLMIQHKLGIKK